MSDVDTNAVLIPAVVSEHPAVVTTFLGGLVVSLLERILLELSVVNTEDRNNKSGGAEVADSAPSTSTE